MARLLTTFVLLSITLAARGMPAPDGHEAQPEKKVLWGGGDCIYSCRSSWGWTGHVFGDDPWGTVMLSGDPVPTSTSCTSSEESTPSSTEAAYTTPSVPNDVPISSTSSSTSPSILSTFEPASSASTRTTVNVFNALPFTGSSEPTTTFTPELAPTPQPAPEPEAEPEIQAPPPPPRPAPAQQDNSGGESGDRAEYLRFHNEARAQHGARPVTFSSELEGFAQEWANNCDFEHSGGKFGRLGENLAAGTGAYSINEMINDWVVEVKDYNPSNPKASHFTQVVWKETTEIGCAKQTCTGIFGNTPATYYVCEYRPAGNVIGRFAENVQK